MYGHLSIIYHEAHHHTYGKDDHIITKYVNTRLVMPRFYINLDLIGILPDIINYDSPRNRVTLCLLFAYKRECEGLEIGDFFF